jgi:hypothetical protein
MRRKLPLASVLLTLLTCLGAACSSLSENKNSAASDGVSEITLSNGGGQMNYWYRITLRHDGTAEYLGDVSPERRRENKPFGQSTKENERVKYRGSLTQTQFETLAKLVTDNGFFSMKENDAGIADAPQTTTGVVRSGTRKEIRDQMGQGGEKLTEIEQAIARTADQIKWERP